MNSRFVLRWSSKLLIAASIGVLVFLFVGCRDRDSGDSNGQPSPDATEATATTSTGGQAAATDTPEASSGADPTPAPEPTSAPALANPGAPGPYDVGVFETSASRESSTGGATRVMDTVVWYPASGGGAFGADYDANEGAPSASGGPFPVIVFSHGSGGNPAQSVFYTTHLASHGFVVVALSHPGNTTADCYPCVNPVELLDAARNRPDDVSAIVEALEDGSLLAGSTISGAIDLSRMGITGHSFGAWTTLISLAEDGRFIAGVPMAPNNAPTTKFRIRDVGVPVLIMSGGLDDTTPPEDQQALFDALPGDGSKYLLTLRRAGHPAFADLCLRIFSGCGDDALPQDEGHRIINEYATAFFLTYVAGVTGYEGYLVDGEVAGGEGTLESK